jgi:hypothetical protein
MEVAMTSLEKALAINPTHASAKSARDAIKGAKKPAAGK